MLRDVGDQGDFLLLQGRTKSDINSWRSFEAPGLGEREFGYLHSRPGIFLSTVQGRCALYVSLNGSLQQIHLLSFCVLKTVEILSGS